MDDKPDYKDWWLEAEERCDATLLALNDMKARAESAEAALAQCRHERDTLANRLEQAEAALAALQTPCVWTPEKDVWGDDYADDGFRTQCGAWYLSRAIKDGHFCPNCGHPVEVAP